MKKREPYTSEMLESVFNTLQEPIVIIDTDFRIKMANTAFLSLFNLSGGKLHDKLLYDISGVDEWNRDLLQKLIDDALKSETGQPELKSVNNSRKPLLIKAKKIVCEKAPLPLLLLTVEDLSEHRHIQKIMAERESWFHELTDNVPVMIWVANTKKERLFFNKTWLNFTGRKVEEEVGDGWLQSVHPEDVEPLLKAYNLSYEKHNLFKLDYRLRRHDGEYRWVQALAKPIYDSNNQFTGFLGTCSEIHDQHLLKEELEQRVKRRTKALQEANTNLERSNSELQQFAYVASHDLQEPLRKIITFSDRLQQRFTEQLPEDARLYIEKITSSAMRMTRLIDDLLNFSRVSRADEQFIETDLNVIVKKVLRDFDTLIGQHKVKIEVGKLPVLQAVPVQMTQLFHNLISNAIKFSAERETPIININCHKLSAKEISVHKELKSGEYYFEITVADNGIGFEQSFAEQIFIIFQRLHEKHTYPGTGIGLALCRKIVAYHNGLIYAVGEPGNGATFYIILPANHTK